MSEDVSAKKKKKYSQEFKHDAKKRVRNGEKEDKVARDLEIPRSTIATWMQKDRDNQQQTKEEQIRNGANSQKNINRNNGNWQTTDMTDCPEMKSVSIMNCFQTIKTPTSDGSKKIKDTTSTSSDPCFINDTKDGEKEDRVTNNINVSKSTISTAVFNDQGKFSTFVSKKCVTDQSEKRICTNMYNEPQKSAERERKKYSFEQQRLAVARVSKGAKAASVSKDMGIPPSTISTWLKKNNLTSSDENGKPVVNLDWNRCEVKHDIFPGCTESTDNSTIHAEKIIGNSTITQSKNCTNDFEYKEGSEGTREIAKKQTEKTNDISANGLKNKCSKQQKCEEVGQNFENDIPEIQKTYVISSNPPSDSSIWIAKAEERFREIDMSSLHDVRLNNQLRNETENGSEQSNTNASSNESFELFSSPALNKTECSTSAEVLSNMKEITERKTASVFPRGDIHKNKEQKKSCDVKSGLSSGTDNIETGNTSSSLKVNLTERNAKNIDSGGEKRTGYTPEVKRDVLERVKGGKTIASVSKDLKIPASTIRDWTKKEDGCSPSLKWKKWQEIMSSNNHGKGWAKRDVGYRLEKLSQHFEDRYGLFQLAVCKPTEKSENIVYVKDGKILTLIERHCKFGFQKSSLINDKLQHDCSIKARCCYLTSQEEAAQEKTKLLQREDYVWNKPCRDDVGNDRLSGDWSNWLLVMTPGDIGDDWIKRDGTQFGYKRKNLEGWLKDEFGIFEVAIRNPETEDESVVFLACGKILTAVGRYCSDDSSAKSMQINDVLNKGYGFLVRYCYAKSRTEEEARKLELQLLTRYNYSWHKQRTKRENIKDEQVLYKWTNWELIMAPVKEDGFVERYGGNVGFRHGNIEALFEDRFGVFELQIARGDRKKVKYVQHGNILILLQRYCIDGYKRSAILNRALDEGYSISVRYQYVNSDNGKENATSVLRQLLAIYDYAWNKTRREHIDDGDIAGDWSDWVTVMTPQIQEGWTKRNFESASKGYHRENFTKFFEEKYGNFEMQVEYHPHFATSGIGGEEVHDRNGKMETVVYIGKGNILTKVRARCCDKTKQSVLIDQALMDGKSISVRHCYAENDEIEKAATLERKLLDRYDYPWIRSKREELYDNDLPGEWSEWSKIMKPGEVEKGWEWRDERNIGFKVNLKGIFKGIFKDDYYGVFELAIEKPYRNTVVTVGEGEVLSELRKYCKINEDGSYKTLQISDALVKRYSILVRKRDVQSQRSATELVERYEYPWNPLNRTKREEVDESCLPGQNWSEWRLLMAHQRNGPEWKRRDSDQAGFRLTDDIAGRERGIYELKIEKGPRTIVVYTGKTKKLSKRLENYRQNGSHIKKDCSRALQCGYDIWVRTRPTWNHDDAENKLLYRYDYAWNTSNNGMHREIFFPDDTEHI